MGFNSGFKGLINSCYFHRRISKSWFL